MNEVRFLFLVYLQPVLLFFICQKPFLFFFGLPECLCKILSQKIQCINTIGIYQIEMIGFMPFGTPGDGENMFGKRFYSWTESHTKIMSAS